MTDYTEEGAIPAVDQPTPEELAAHEQAVREGRSVGGSGAASEVGDEAGRGPQPRDDA
jgi:hypothetical protein